MQLVGRGHSAADRLLRALNLPKPINKNSWSSHTKVLEIAANELLEKEILNAALEL